MSHLDNTSLSLSARLLCCLGPPSAILFTSIASPRTGLLSPLTFLPTAWSLKKWQESNNADPSCRGELEPMIWTFAAAGTVGITTVLLVQIGVCKAATAILFGSGEKNKDFWNEFLRTSIDGLTADELKHRAELAATWQNWVFNGALTFVAAGLVEETLKYLPIVYAHHRDAVKKRRRRNRAYIDYALAGGLSFSLMENIGFLYASSEGSNDTWPKLLLTLFERMVLGQLGHLSMSLLTALRAIRRDLYGDQISWWGVVGPSVMFHGAFDFIAFSACALDGNVGWIHPTGVRKTIALLGVGVGLVGTVISLARQEWKWLDNFDHSSSSDKDDSSQT